MGEFTRSRPLDRPRRSADARARASADAVWPAAGLGTTAVLFALWAGALEAPVYTGPGRVELAGLVVVWAVAGVLVAWRRPTEPLGLLLTGGAVLGSTALLGAAVLGRIGILDSTRSVASAARAFGVAGTIAVALHLAVGLPTGRVRSVVRRLAAAVGDVAAIGVAAWLYAERPAFDLAPLVGLGALAVLLGVPAFVVRLVRARAGDRARLGWAGGGALAALLGAGAAVALRALVGWPTDVGAAAVAASALVPVGIAVGAVRRAPARRRAHAASGDGVV